MGTSEGVTNSGLSVEDEYQRTMGAMFAFFWLMRLESDGAQAFAFGVGHDWGTLSQESVKPRRSEQDKQARHTFMEKALWGEFEKGFLAAGLLLEKPHDDANASGGKTSHDEEQTLAMLVLTAIHDIMKLKELLPTVENAHAPFCGYGAGEVISDHDEALGYVLEHFPD